MAQQSHGQESGARGAEEPGGRKFPAFVGGALGGCLAAFVLQPLDLLKTRQQADVFSRYLARKGACKHACVAARPVLGVVCVSKKRNN